MSKLNRPGSAPVNTVETFAAKHDLSLAVSMNGNVQFCKPVMQRFYERVVSTLIGKDTFYKSSDALVKAMRADLKELVEANALDFIANTIIHARTDMNIRTMPIVTVVEFAKALHINGKQYPNLRRVVCDVIQRADQITDLYAYALDIFGSKNKVPMAIKRGVGDAFNKFSEYQFGKYDRGNSVKLRDVLRIVHPSAVSVEQGEIFQKIMAEQLQVPYTWEVELSRNGQLPESERKSKAQLWTELVTSGKLGYMALLRNLRNIVEAGVGQDVMVEISNRIADLNQVRTSKQLPYAFVNAYNAALEVNAPNVLLNALSQALEFSIDNVPQLGNDVVLFVDSSGSMQGGHIFGNGHSAGMSPADYASVFAAMLVKANKNAYNVRVVYFDTIAREIKIDSTKSVMSLTEELRGKSRGGSTNLKAAFSLMKDKGWKPDTLIVLSDMEVDYMGRVEVPHHLHNNEDCVKVAINFSGGSSTPLSHKAGWYQMAGWSDKMFQFIPAMRESVSIVDTLNVPYRGV